MYGSGVYLPMNVDIWDQAYKNQGALAVMALLLVFIAMSVARFALRISNPKIKASIDDLAGTRNHNCTLEPRCDSALFHLIGKRHSMLWKSLQPENGVVEDIRNLPNGRIILPSHRDNHGVAFFQYLVTCWDQYIPRH